MNQSLTICYRTPNPTSQIRNGCMGSGYVVVDVLADSKTVWETLLNFERYAEMIPTIRRVRVTSRPWKGVTKGLFTLSKFRFRLSVVHKHRPEEVRVVFDCLTRLFFIVGSYVLITHHP